MLILKVNSPPNSYFSFLEKIVLLKGVHHLKIYQNTNVHDPTLTGASFHPPQKFEWQPFWNGCRYGIKNYGV
jgi:hypothetical protein